MFSLVNDKFEIIFCRIRKIKCEVLSDNVKIYAKTHIVISLQLNQLILYSINTSSLLYEVQYKYMQINANTGNDNMYSSSNKYFFKMSSTIQ